VVAFLEKPEESNGFAEIIDFLKASSVHYALTINPVIHTSCIEQFWATAKIIDFLQALVDKKRVIVTESSIRRDLHLDDAEGTNCLPTATIFEELARMGYEKPCQKHTFYKAFFSPQWKYFIHTITQCLSAKSTVWNKFSCSMASLIICLATNQKFNLSKYIFDAMVKHLDGGVKFLMYLRFSGRITPLFATMMVQVSKEVGADSGHPTDSTQVPILDQPSTSSKPKKKQPSKKTQTHEEEVSQAETEHEESYPHLPMIHNLVKRIQRLERKKMSRPTGLKRLRKVGMSRRVESSEDQESLGVPEDASKQGRSIKDINADVDVSLVDETQERHNDDLMFDTGVLEDDEMHVTAGEAVTTASVDDSVVPTTIEEITLAQTLIQIKAVKPKVVTTAATITTTIRPKDKWVVVQEPSEFRVPQETQPLSSKDKGKGIMIELEVPLKIKDQNSLDEQIARDIQAMLDAELLEEQKLARKQEEEANIALIESWENTQAMMEADRLLAERLQSKEREELTDEEKAKLFMELMEKRRKHFAALRAQEKRNRPPTKAQKRTQMSTYLKHMGNEEGREETAKGSRKKMLGRKRAGKEQQKESLKKQKVEEEKESEEVEEDDEVELKKLLVIKKDEDIAIDAIPLATKLPVIIDYKLHKEGMMLQGIDREDLEALWRIVKAKYGDTRPEDEFERVLYGDLRVMFEPDIKSDVWRMLQGYRVTTWKLIDSSRVHFENPRYAKPKEEFGIWVFMASLASVFKDPGNEEKDGLVSLDTAMVPLPSSLEYITWSGVTANEKKRFLVVVVLGGLFEIRNHIVNAVVIARILKASLVLPVLIRDERISSEEGFIKGRDFILLSVTPSSRWSTISAKLPRRIDKEITNHWHTHLKNALSKGTLTTREVGVIAWDKKIKEQMKNLRTGDKGRWSIIYMISDDIGQVKRKSKTTLPEVIENYNLNMRSRQDFLDSRINQSYSFVKRARVRVALVWVTYREVSHEGHKSKAVSLRAKRTIVQDGEANLIEDDESLRGTQHVLWSTASGVLKNRQLSVCSCESSTGMGDLPGSLTRGPQK
ncbi:ribonuclease H-like domain-containing protein, partial [Tanacetum coccineum]